MADERIPPTSEHPDETPGQDVRAGKGRRDEVGRTPVYPASGPLPDNPDVKVVTPGEMGHPTHGGPPAPAEKKEED